MSDLKISQLNNAAVLAGDEYIPLTQRNPVTNKLQTVFTTPNALADFIMNVLSTGTSTNTLVPVGTVLPFAGLVTNVNIIPGGFLLCDGSQQSIQTYPALYSVIGNTYGTGSAATLFKLPDLRGRVVMGYNAQTDTWTPNFGNWNNDNTLRLGGSGGEFYHQLTIDELPAHTHHLTDPGHTHALTRVENYDRVGTPLNDDMGGGQRATRAGAIPPATTGVTIDSTGGNTPHQNLSPYLSLNYIIKY